MWSFVLPAAALFAAGWLAVWLLRGLLLRFAPRWLVGPNGFLIDTRGRLGILQMHDPQLLEHQRQTDAIRGSGEDNAPRC